MDRADITPAIIRELLDYDPETGLLTWRHRDRSWFDSDRVWKRWNTRYARKPALALEDRRGYKRGTILSHDFLAHRVAYAHFYGVWPNIVDHENHDKGDNRIENLSDGDSQSNSRNQKCQKGSATGHPGISLLMRESKPAYQVSIGIGGGKVKYLGRRRTLEEAVDLRKTAEREYGYHPNHGT